MVDPYASSEEVKHEYGFELAKSIGKDYDAVIVAVNHKEYVSLTEEYFQSISTKNGVLVDVKGVFRHKMKKITYWSL